jgi:hypothetical protein
MTYNTLVNLNYKNHERTAFTLDTGASFTTIGSLYLITEKLLSMENILNIGDFFNLMQLTPKIFQDASGKETKRYLCYTQNTIVDNVKFDRFYFFLDPNPTSVALIGNDIIYNCSLHGENDSIILDNFNYEKYLSYVDNIIIKDNLQPLSLNALFIKLDNYFDIKNTAAYFRDLYENEKNK